MHNKNTNLSDQNSEEPNEVEIIDNLKSRSIAKREQGLQALNELGDHKAVKLLITALKRGEDESRFDMALVSIGSAAVEPLINLLEEEDSSLHFKAVMLLGHIGDRRAIEPLLKSLQHKDKDVRIWAVISLGSFSDEPRMSEALIQVMLNDPDEQTCLQAAQGLTIRNRSNEALEPLITMLGYKDYKLRKIAADHLGNLEDARAVEPLLTTLKRDRDVSVRARAAWALGKLGDLKAIEPLIEILSYESEAVQKGAAWALGKLGDQRAVEPLISLLKNGSEMVRTCVAEALGELKALEPLINLLKDDSAWVRGLAVIALSKLDNPKAVEAIITATKDEDERVRAQAIRILRFIGYEEKAKVLALTEKEKRDLIRKTIVVSKAKQPYIYITAEVNEHQTWRFVARACLQTITKVP